MFEGIQELSVLASISTKLTKHCNNFDDEEDIYIYIINLPIIITTDTCYYQPLQMIIKIRVFPRLQKLVATIYWHSILMNLAIINSYFYKRTLMLLFILIGNDQPAYII